jgi:hypothetical protein
MDIHSLRSIIEFAGFEIYEDYSGRNMYGKMCIGFTHYKRNEVAIADLLDSAASLGETPELSLALRNMMTDNLGKGTIVYFPDYETEI